MQPISGILDKAMQMPSGGLSANVGEKTLLLINPLEQEYEVISLQANQKEQRQQQLKDSQNIKGSPQAQSRLTSLLLVCFDGLNVYGKEPEQLGNITKLFQLVLGGFKISDVETAFAQYLESNTNMPTPADIVKIIEPPVEPRKWCAITFIDIKRRTRENQFITDAEKKYVQDFISARIKDLDTTSIIDDAMRQVEQQNRQYWLE